MTVVYVLGALVGSTASAQSSPSDLTDASLAELLVMDLDDWQGTSNAPRFRFGYHYLRSSFGGYREGDTVVSPGSVLFEPATGEARTDGNFPVLPTQIVQEAHIFDASYNIAPQFSLGFALPIIRQSTAHVSIVEDYEAFTIASSGIGDLLVNGSGTLVNADHHALRANLGLSIPLGSIDEEGDTPREPGDQQLPYTMQIGSGTWDVPVSLTYSVRTEGRTPVTGGLQSTGKVRFGRNGRDYRLGNRAMLTGWFGVQPTPWLEPSVKLSGVVWGPIVGRDDSLIVDGDFVYPAPVTDPSLFGGRTLTPSLALSVGLPGAEDTWSHQRVELEIGRPVYQFLNGPQPQEVWRMSAGLRLGY